MEAFNELPPITRSWLLASVACTAATHMNWVRVDDFAFIWQWVIYEREWWRVAATFFYWGRPSFGLVMNLYFLVQNVRDYEVRPRGGGGGGPLADFTWQLLLGAALMLAGALLLEAAAPGRAGGGWLPPELGELLRPPVFLSIGLAIYVQCLWCLSYPEQPVNLYSFRVPAFYLPWVLAAFHLVNGSDISLDVLGIGAAHAVHACLPTTRGAAPPARWTPALTPRWWTSLLHQAGAAPLPAAGHAYAD